MIDVIGFAAKTIIYKIRFGQRLTINGIQAFFPNSSVYISDNGRIELGKVTAQKNVHISAAGGHIRMGKGVSFNKNCILVSRAAIEIGDDCIFGPNVCIYDHDHRFDMNNVYKMEYTSENVVIENGCWIGAGVIILKGTHIGEGSIIGAGAIVKGNIPAHSILTVHQDQHIQRLVDK